MGEHALRRARKSDRRRRPAVLGHAEDRPPASGRENDCPVGAPASAPSIRRAGDGSGRAATRPNFLQFPALKEADRGAVRRPEGEQGPLGPLERPRLEGVEGATYRGTETRSCAPKTSRLPSGETASGAGASSPSSSPMKEKVVPSGGRSERRSDADGVRAGAPVRRAEKPGGREAPPPPPRRAARVPSAARRREPGSRPGSPRRSTAIAASRRGPSASARPGP